VQPGDFNPNGNANQNPNLTQYAQLGSQSQQEQNAKLNGAGVVLDGFIAGSGIDVNPANGQPGPDGPTAVLGVQTLELLPGRGRVRGVVAVGAIDNNGDAGGGFFTFDGKCTTPDCSQFNATGKLEGQITDPTRTISNGTLKIATATAAEKAQFPGVSFCQCDFVKWGFWQLQFDYVNDMGQPSRFVLNHGVWNAGQATAVAEIPAQGVATYTGHAIAAINNNGNTYLAGSNFSNTVNFGNRTGFVNIASLDSRNYYGTVYLGYGVNSFAGTLTTGTYSYGPTAFLAGKFYGLGAKEMAGGFSIMGGYASPNYFGAGTFAASK
jgi:hypothetical protein